MALNRDDLDLTSELRALRPSPRAGFATELDERAAAGFPRPSRASRGPLASVIAAVRSLSARRLVFATGGVSVALIAIATAIVVSNESARGPAQPRAHHPEGPFELSAPVPAGAGGAVGESAESAAAGFSGSRSLSGHREVERSAEVDLLAEPADIAGDSTRVFAVVHDADGIVLHSTTTSGRDARASFDLLIPSARLGDALAALSRIDEVRSRHEATADITAPTVAFHRQLADSRARIDSLLARLSAAETESQEEAIEAELQKERRRAAKLSATLTRLKRRVDFSRVSVRIESESSASAPSAWGFDDALRDAGRILAIAAGVTIIGLAVIAPLALLVALAWLAYRAWLRRAREGVLS